MKKNVLILTLLLSASFPVFASIGDVVSAIFIFFAIILAIAIFFIPTIIAFKRSHRNRWIIFMLNFLGATVVFWVIALVWALNKFDDPIKGGHQIDGQDGDRVL